MKPKSTILIALLAGLCLAVIGGCAKQEMQQAGFLEDYSKLKKDPDGLSDYFYIKDNVDWSAYDKLLINQITFFIDNDTEYKGIDADDFNQLAQYWNNSMVQSLSKSYKVVAEPGPNTLRLIFAITHLKPNRPVIGTVTTVVPAGLAASLVKKGATGTHIGMGEAGFEAEMRDAQTGELLMASINSSYGKKYKLAKTVTKWGQVESIFDSWTDNLRKRLNMRTGR